MTIREPVWCAFCEDRPAIGRMVIMKDQSREQIDVVIGSDGAACDLHGRQWTGIPVAAHDVTGEVAVLQYVHPNFVYITEEHILDFAEEKTCCECGDPTDPIPLWAAERILRAAPHLILDQDGRWEGICIRCAHTMRCDRCSEGVPHDEPEDDDEPDGWQTHPYLH